MRIRASIGTLSVLGLSRIKMSAVPTTAYFLQYSEEGCLGECAYCTQSHVNLFRKDYLSRVIWPKCELERVVVALSKNSTFKRICLQTVIRRGFLSEVINFTRVLRELGVRLPLSIAVTPLPKGMLETLKSLGVNRVGIGLDVVTPELFVKVRKPYSWSVYWSFIDKTLEVFGKTTVHLIFGLGEKVIDFISTMASLVSRGADVALFPYTPVRNLRVSKRPELKVYRVIQAIRYLLTEGYNLDDIVKLSGHKLLVKDVIYDVPLEAFLTSGCPNCNRPFYTESPLRIYNYPSFNLLIRDKFKVYEQLNEGVFKLSEE